MASGCFAVGATSFLYPLDTFTACHPTLSVQHSSRYPKAIIKINKLSEMTHTINAKIEGHSMNLQSKNLLKN